MSFQYILRRTIQSIVLLWVVTIVVFLILRVTTGDPATVLLGESATPQAIESLRKAMGLDKPLYEQYWVFIKNGIRGDFGDSIRAQRPALPFVLERFPATVELSAVALFFAILLGIPLGIFSAVKKYSFYDSFLMSFALLSQSMPGFWLGLMLIVFVAVRLKLLPASGKGTIAHLILPGITLAFYLIGLIIRLSRSSMLEVMNQDYIRTAYAKGVPDRLVIYKHALKNALIPIVTVIGLQIGTLLGGAVITETVFAWPGIGSVAVQAIYQRDYPVIQVVVLLSAFIFVGINLLVDIVYSLIDPRITHR